MELASFRIDALLEIEAVLLYSIVTYQQWNLENRSIWWRLYKQAGLNLDEESHLARMWLNAEPMGSSWSQVERLPEFETLFQPEEIQNFTQSM